MSKLYRQVKCWLWTCVCLPLAAFMLMYCRSVGFPSLHLQQPPSHISGFRRLLQDPERLHLAMNASPPAMDRRLPTCIIVGVRKCGTRALLEFLNLHPEIVAAEGEIHFFNDDGRYRQGLEWYQHQMPPSQPHHITVEKTPGYFISSVAPHRIHRMNSTVRLLVVLRHPTMRVLSDYTQVFHNRQARNRTLPDFEERVLDRETGAVNTGYRAVQISMYHQYLRRWMTLFPRQQIHVVDGDRLISDPVWEVQQIEQFLGLQHRIDYSLLYYNSSRGFYCMRGNPSGDTGRCLGASKGRRHPHVKPSLLKRLDKFFRPHNRQLFGMIQRSFDWA